MNNHILKIINWLESKRDSAIAERYGAAHTCPYCLQCVQSDDGWSIVKYEKNEWHDVITCGVCKGQSLWYWEMIWVYKGPLKPPEAKHTPSEFGPPIELT